MKFSFDAWRGKHCPLGWIVERHTEYTHLHGDVRPDGYALTFQGNVHIPLTPALADVSMALYFRVEPVLCDQTFDVSLVFRYDRRVRRGLAVRLVQQKEELRIAVGTQTGNRFTALREERLPAITVSAEPMLVNLAVRGDTALVHFAGHAITFNQLPAGKGHVAICRGRHPGDMIIHRLAIETTDDIPACAILPRTTVPFPVDVNGMDVPIRYTIEVTRRGDVYEVEAELAGGPPEKTYDHPGNYHARVIDWLTRPYIRFANEGEQTDNFVLADDTLVLCAPPIPNRFFYNRLHKQPVWPLKVRFFLDHLPTDPRLIVGYEHYCCEQVKGRQGGPTEAHVEPGSGRILYCGPAVTQQQPELRIESPPSPALLARLAKSDPRHEQAVAYVRNNHYFVEGEPCRLNLVVYHDRSFAIDEATLRCQLEDAFFRPVQEGQPGALHAVACPGIGIAAAAAEVSFGSDLPVGVYHLRVTLQWGVQRVERYCALEVMPASSDAPAAPRASGLPVMLSMPNEVRGLATDAFDPWHGMSDDVAHYTSICCYLPDFGSQYRIWDVLRAYGREWFAYVCTRTTDRPAWENHPDVIAHCDYLFTTDDPKREGLRYYVARPGMYRGFILDALRRFVRDTGIDLAIEPGNALPADRFRELFDRHWYRWMDYFADDYHVHVLRPLRDKLHAINPRLKHASYGPIQTYFGHYLGPHQLTALGIPSERNARTLGDGFMLLEDYPYACRYGLGRGVYQLASCKMALPRVTVYPELYGRGVQGCPDGAVLYAWPPAGAVSMPPAFYRKNAFEYAFAATWFDAGGFHYWKDHGFHTSKWSRDYFEVLLRAWGVVHDHPPRRPLRTTAFVSSEACCRAHGKRLSDADKPSVFNTTDEAPAWAYEMARADGQLAGFVTRIESIAELKAADVDTLVLPPLYDITESQRAAIRGLHEQGVNLLAFEIVSGLEDLFGVVETDEPWTQPLNLRVNAQATDNPLALLADMTEYTDTSDHAMRYTASVPGAQVLLEGEAPVLFYHQTAWGRTALYNLPPTMVRRDTLDARYADGAESLSPLMNRSVQLMLRALGSPAVTTTEGKLIAFEDENGNVVIIVEEDAFPETPRPIHPKVKLRLPGVRADQLACDRDFAVIRDTSGDVAIRLHLDVHECAVVTIKPKGA